MPAYADEDRDLCNLLEEAAYLVALGSLDAQSALPRDFNERVQRVLAALPVAAETYWAGRGRADKHPTLAASRRDTPTRPAPDVIFEQLDTLIPCLRGTQLGSSQNTWDIPKTGGG